MDQPIVVVDTETTGLHGAPHLIELGAVRVFDGEIQDSFESLVCPQVPIDPAASEVHGLGDENVAGAPPASEVLADFFTWLGEDWLCAHRASFDARVLAFEASRAELALPEQPWIDTLALARKLIPESPDHRLDTLCEVLGLEEGEHHRALADAVWCWQILEACAERLDSEKTPTRAALLTACRGLPVTMPAEAPKPGRSLKPRHRRLGNACRERSEVTLIYGSTEQAPVPLAVRPQLLFHDRDRSYLEAECRSSGLLKTYRLDRIQRVVAH